MLGLQMHLSMELLFSSWWILELARVSYLQNTLCLFLICFDHNYAIPEWNFKSQTERYYLRWVLLMYLYKCMGTLSNYLSSFVIWDCIFVLDAGKEAGFITCVRTVRIWFNANEHDEPKNCLGVVVMLYATFKQFRELNLNRSRLQLSK